MAMNRRQFLQSIGVAGAGVALAGCGGAGAPLTGTGPLAAYSNTDLLARADVNAPPGTGDQLGQQLKAMVGAGVKTPFWMPNLWPAHLIFLSLLYQSDEVRLYRH